MSEKKACVSFFLCDRKIDWKGVCINLLHLLGFIQEFWCREQPALEPRCVLCLETEQCQLNASLKIHFPCTAPHRPNIWEHLLDITFHETWHKRHRWDDTTRSKYAIIRSYFSLWYCCSFLFWLLSVAPVSRDSVLTVWHRHGTSYVQLGIIGKCSSAWGARAPTRGHFTWKRM